MKTIARCLLTVAFLLCTAAHADYDPVLEAREAAQRKAAAQKAAKEKAENDRLSREYALKTKRAYLGKEANGLTDAQVDKRYADKVAEAQAKARAASVEGVKQFSEAQALSAKSRPQADQSMRGMYGKSLT
ncbi:MAG: hypothetical protein JNN20_09880, partial [Betaproteobacteria bacterium]|nr:hypothetical protein [Betaproteobacteria bacterium]